MGRLRILIGGHDDDGLGGGDCGRLCPPTAGRDDDSYEADRFGGWGDDGMEQLRGEVDAAGLAAIAVATPGGDSQLSRAVVTPAAVSTGLAAIAVASRGGWAESALVTTSQVIVIASPGEDPQPCRAVVASATEDPDLDGYHDCGFFILILGVAEYMYKYLVMCGRFLDDVEDY